MLKVERTLSPLQYPKSNLRSAALGLDEEQIRSLNINIPKKGKKNKKTEQQIEEDLENFELRPLESEEVPTLINAIRKAIGNTRNSLGIKYQ